MASVQAEANHGAGSPPWKLYHNPHYAPHDAPHLSSCCSPSASCQARNRRDPEPPMIIAQDDDEEEVVEEELDDQEGYGHGAMSSELELCVARIRDLRAELVFERRMRRKAEALSEALAAELANERRRGEAAEVQCRALREEAGAARAALEGVEEERRMLRVAELWREERVQMKLADARAAMEEKLREIDDAVAQLHHAAAAAAAARDINKNASSCCSSPNGSKSTSQQQSPSRSQHGQQSPSRSQPHRREPGGENPHIRRGIKGFVEFPKAVRLRPREEESVDLVSNLECQRAQLRVLMRHRSPAAGMGLIGAPENLVV